MVRIFSKDWIVFDAHNSTLADAWDNQVRDLANKIQSPENPVAKSARALREIATLLETV